MKPSKSHLRISLYCFAAFLLLTMILRCTDVAPIGPEGSQVGLSTLNARIHNTIGIHWGLYTLTDWLQLIPVATCIGFGALGLSQWIRRKHILKVDRSILLLGVFYLLLLAVFVFFEIFIVNYRPVLINGIPEASYPSSTTILVICVMSTAMLQFGIRVQPVILRQILSVLTLLFILLMVILRLISGVHWFTDILGGILLSSALVMLYAAFLYQEEK